MSRSNVAVVALGLALLGVGGPARGQFFPEGSAGGGPGANIDGFTVAGKGETKAKPNRLEIELDVTAASELSSDAIVKYRDARKRLQEAFAALKLGNVAVEERGLLIDQKGAAFNPYFGFGDMAPARKAKVEVQLSRKLVVTCTDVRAMDEEALLQLVAKLLDVAQDAGGKVGGGPPEYNPYYGYSGQGSNKGLVRFILDDFDALQEEAYGKAIADARARAGRLAKLSGVELGRVAGVREIAVPGEKAAAFNYGGGSSDDEVRRKRLESSRFQEIPVRVELQVRFDAAPAKAQREGGGR